jgi:tripartite-type tricarboxylate transporter receptor subunit TctC
MKLPRRKFLHLAAGAAALPAVSRVARAQAYPTRPVRIVVGFAAGGSTDIAARIIGQWLSEQFGQSFVIENRPRAGANLAAEAVVRSAADGHTLLLIGASDTINATLYQKLSFNFLRDIAPVAGLTRQPQVLLANPTLPARTFPELTAHAKANPGKITIVSAGNGSTAHLAGELLKLMAGIDLVHVPYRGAGPALTDLLAGHVQVSFAGIAGSIEYAKTGKLRTLAVTTLTRSQALPDVPAVSEFVPGYEAVSLFGIGAPKDTQPAIIDKLNNAINAALADPKIEARFADLGGTTLALSAAAFGRLLSEETEKWARSCRHQAGVSRDLFHKCRSANDQPRLSGDQDETSPSQILAFGRGRCGVSDYVADCAGTSLSVAAGAHHRAVSAGWRGGYIGALSAAFLPGSANRRARLPQGLRCFFKVNSIY